MDNQNKAERIATELNRAGVQSDIALIPLIKWVLEEIDEEVIAEKRKARDEALVIDFPRGRDRLFKM